MNIVEHVEEDLREKKKFQWIGFAKVGWTGLTREINVKGIKKKAPIVASN